MPSQSLTGRCAPITLVAARWFVRERHFDQAGFESGAEIRRGEVVSVSQPQGRLQLSAPRLVRQRLYQELHMLGDLAGTMPGVLPGVLPGLARCLLSLGALRGFIPIIMFGVFPRGVVTDLLVHQKAHKEPSTPVVALEYRDR